MMQRIKRFLSEEILPYIRAKDKKSYLQQCKDMYALWSYYRCLPYHYIKYGVYRKSSKGEVLDYLPPKLVKRYQRHVNPADSRINANDKIIFNQLMTTADVVIAPIYFIIDRYSGITHLESNTNIQFDSFLNALSQYDNKRFFVKPYDGTCGEGVFKFELKDGELLIENKVHNEAAFFDALLLPRFEKLIVQSAIEQHQVLHTLCPSSVNTVRIHTLVLNNEIVSQSAILRIGNGESCIDNAAKGGLFVKINMDTGQLGFTATNIAKYGGITTDCHPVTGVKFEDVTIPYWSEVLKIIKVGAEQLKPLKALGWDVAIGVDGPVVLETNQGFDILLCEYGANGLRKTALGQEIIAKFLSSKSSVSG